MFAVETDELSVFALLDLSAAVVTVDHGMLLLRLLTIFGVGGPVLGWIKSYLTNRVQLVCEAHHVFQRGRMGRGGSVGRACDF